MTWTPPLHSWPLHRNHGDWIYGEWWTLARLAGVEVTAGEIVTDVWNRIATELGMPTKAGEDTVTADEWNEAVNRATARHA